METLFPLGRLVITRTALHTLNAEDVHTCIQRHANGDWGDVCREDHQANQQALKHAMRLFSVYHDRAGVKFYIITEHDRSITTVLLPEDY